LKIWLPRSFLINIEKCPLRASKIKMDKIITHICYEMKREAKKYKTDGAKGNSAFFTQ